MPTLTVPENFWQALDSLVASSEIIIDRPAGSAHPRYPEKIYPYDYGYLQGTTAADGGGIDIWRGGLPGLRVTAVICTVDLLKKDSEIKILINCTLAEAQTILETHNQNSMSGALIIRA